MRGLAEFNTDTAKVMAVRLGAGCSEGCAHCGVYEQGDHPGDYIAKEVGPDRIAACLMQEVQQVMQDQEEPAEPQPQVDQIPEWRFVQHPDGDWHIENEQGEVLDEQTIRPVIDTRTRLVHYFDSVVTTDVNQEPLNGDAFLHFYRLVRLLSGGQSRVPLITHGLKANDKGKVLNGNAEIRLEKIVEIMDSGDIIALSMDRARSGGKISHTVNVRSYAETINRLKLAIEKGVRVTVSLQGNDDSASDLYKVKVDAMWTEVKQLLIAEYGWTHQGIGNIHTDTGRDWVWKGRAEQMEGVKPENECPVLPDTRYVVRQMSATHTKMVAVDAISGRTFTHTHNRGRTYNDLATLSRWLSRANPTLPMNGWKEVAVDDKPLSDLTHEFTSNVRFAAFKAERLARKAAPTIGDAGALATPESPAHESGPVEGGGADEILEVPPADVDPKESGGSDDDT